MGKQKNKKKQLLRFYVVWYGKRVGVCTSWEECVEYVKGVDGAMFKKALSIEEAEKMFNDGPPAYYKRWSDEQRESSSQVLHVPQFNECTPLTCTFPKCSCEN